MTSNKYIALDHDKLEDIETLEIDKNAKDELEEIHPKIAKLQDKMYAEHKYSLLICLQGMDTAGKDSLIREVFKTVNVNGINVYGFKTPSTKELSHDFLWRHYKVLPKRGKIGIFNRTHYENVLVTRVHPEYILRENIPSITDVSAIDDAFFHRRMEGINHFEQFLVNNGTIVLKFYLHLSKEEQKNRLLRRLDKPEKNWKFSASDIKERQFWEQYIEAYDDLLVHTSTPEAPWYIIPSDHKNTARLIVAKIIAENLKKYNFRYPQLNEEGIKNLAVYRQQLENE